MTGQPGGTHQIKYRLLVVGGAVVLAAAVGLLWMARAPREDATSTGTAAPKPETTVAAPAPPPGGQARRAAPAAPAAKAGGTAADPEANFPPPDPDDVVELPEPAPPTPAVVRTRKQAELDLLDASLTDLERNVRSAESSGDGAAAERDRHRIDRLRARREALVRELAEIR